jgi:hypothetical protein
MMPIRLAKGPKAASADYSPPHPRPDKASEDWVVSQFDCGGQPVQS